MAHTKAGGSTKLGRDSISKRLGVKIQDGDRASVGQIIVRQRGTRYIMGKNVKMGGDNTIYSMANGLVKFSSKSKSRFDGRKRQATRVSVE